MKTITTLITAGMMLAVTAFSHAAPAVDAESAKSAIADASTAIKNAEKAGHDTSQAKRMLNVALSMYENGNMGVASDYAVRADVMSGLDLYESYLKTGKKDNPDFVVIKKVIEVEDRVSIMALQAEDEGADLDESNTLLMEAYQAVKDEEFSDALDRFAAAEKAITTALKDES